MISVLYRNLIPKSVRSLLRRHLFIAKVAKRLWYIQNPRYAQQVLEVLDGRFERVCNICGYKGLFRAKSIPMKTDAHCPSCKSVGKHRLLWHIIQSYERIGRELRFLHFAPEQCLSEHFGSMTEMYVTADYMRSDVDRKINIEKIDFPEDSFDIVVCNHVLEHVDHRKALPELFRILAPGGRAFLTVPIVWAWDTTYENRSIISEAERELHFDQFDHLCVFGRDFVLAVEQAGFQVAVYTSTPEMCVQHSFLPGEMVFVAKKT